MREIGVRLALGATSAGIARLVVGRGLSLTGLGLAISLEDANLHDGRLDVWSEPGVGSCFRLTLPRDRRVPIRLSPVELPPAEVLDELIPADQRDERMGGAGDARR